MTDQPKAMLRFVRKALEPGLKHAGRTALLRVEVVVDDEVVGLLSGVASYGIQMPVDGVVAVDLSVTVFDEVFEEVES